MQKFGRTDNQNGMNVSVDEIPTISVSQLFSLFLLRRQVIGSAVGREAGARMEQAKMSG